jgi:drug/metabolite transporter (DMT)-like permease
LPPSENLRGILLMCASMAAFTINDTFMKSVTQTLPLYQTIGLRGVIAVIGLTVLALATRAFTFRPNRRDAGFILLRSLADVAATITFLTALLHMPIANLSAILQALPLLITLGAALVFGDRIGWRRMTAILVGLIGVLIIIRPGTEGFDRWSLLGLASVACVVVRDLSVRPLQGQIPSTLVALGAAVAVTLMGWTGTPSRAGRPPPPGRPPASLVPGFSSSSATSPRSPPCATATSASSPRSAIPRFSGPSSWASSSSATCPISGP